ncbi:hypothetical protein F2Q69_00059519 [Brassica cretica]|uniref:Uncharacterized protein n=1 Tax=Brassica cretica TaxID=69181 RepID=A0A8S9RCC9_BRACR|nr:hypothetical protein F2Q69_00059519 [Brassica cretica]
MLIQSTNLRVILHVSSGVLFGDLGPIFDEEEEGEAVSVLLAVQKVAKDVVHSGPEADHEKDLTTAYDSGDILGSLSSAKLVQPFVCKDYDPVELLRPEEERGGLMLNKKSMYGFVGESPTKKIQANSFGAMLIQSTNLRVILQFRAYQVVCCLVVSQRITIVLRWLALDRGYIKSHSASLDDPFNPSQFQKCHYLLGSYQTPS